MPAQRRIRSKVVSVSGGGGGTPIIGNVLWGPDFGENADDLSHTIGTSHPMFTELGLENTQGAGTNMDLESLALTFIDQVVGVTADLDDLGLTYNDQSVGVNMDLDALGLENTQSVGANVTNDAIGMENTQGVGTNMDLEDLALTYIDQGVRSAHTMDALGLEYIDQSVGVNMDLDALGITYIDQSVGAHNSGDALGAPFFIELVGNTATGVSPQNIVITKGANVVDGDYLVAMISVGGTSPAISPPAGWTLEETAGTSPLVRCYTRVAASEGGTWTFVGSGTGTVNCVGVVQNIRGYDTVTPVDVSTPTSGSAADPVAPAITTSVANCLIIDNVCQTPATATNFTSPAGWSERYDSNVGAVTPNCSVGATRVRPAATEPARTYDGASVLAAAYASISVAIRPGTVVLAA